MKLLRFENDGRVGLGVLIEDGVIATLDGIAAEYPTMLSIIAGGDKALDAVRAALKADPKTVGLKDVKLIAPVERPGKFLGIGMNYARHVKEAARLGVEAPKQQFWFNKQTTCLAGPFDDIVQGVSDKCDYEVELGVVIGQPAKGVSEADAPKHVFGYVVMNDVSARDWQMHSPTFMMGKSFDTHGPIGPWIVTADEIGDPHDLQLRCWVNGELRQDERTSDLIFNVWQQVSYLSQAFTLEPGDLLATGTPSGVGVAMQPPVFLKAGDVVTCEVEKIGTIENKVV